MRGVMAEAPAKSSAPVGRRERRKLARRNDLIRSGRRLFSERGLYEARIEDLATEAGIAKGTVYTYFSDKDELIRDVAAAGYAELEARVVRCVRRGRGDEGVLRQAVRAHLQFFAANPDLMRILHQVRGMLTFDRPEWLPLRNTMNAYLVALSRILSVAPRLSRIRAGDRLTLARMLFGAVSGVVSVQTTSDPHPRRRHGSRALVSSIVAMALAYIDGSEGSARRQGIRTVRQGAPPPGDSDPSRE
jgi:TetR/AcrR family fatty acid metabolism transcriptional regulator